MIGSWIPSKDGASWELALSPSVCQRFSLLRVRAYGHQQFQTSILPAQVGSATYYSSWFSGGIIMKLRGSGARFKETDITVIPEAHTSQ